MTEHKVPPPHSKIMHETDEMGPEEGRRLKEFKVIISNLSAKEGCNKTGAGSVHPKPNTSWKHFFFSIKIDLIKVLRSTFYTIRSQLEPSFGWCWP